MKQLCFILFVCTLFICSCTPYKDVIVYQQTNNDTITRINQDNYHPVIQRNDVIEIYVMSTSPEASKYFNFTGKEDNVTSMLNGYLVDIDGKIQIPIIGDVVVAGLTSPQARDTISKRLAQYLINPSVKLNIKNFKVSVIGEVKTPGLITVPNEKLTLPEALALAGDVTIYSKLDNVTIIRDSLGYKTYGYVDLRTRNLFSSPFYNLHQNDIVYVHPLPKRKSQTDNFYRIIPVVLSAVTLIIAVTQVITQTAK